MPRSSAEDRVQEVFAASYRRLVGQLTGVTGDPVEAEDAVMEAFARAVNSSRSFLAADNPEAWLRTVAVNVTRTRWRRSRFFRDVSHRLMAAESYADLPEDRLALLAALRQLPVAQREAIALHHLADLPVHAVAETVGAPVGTVKARLSRDIADRAPQPGFDAVVDRARAGRRRRRTTIASGLAAAVVVAGIGLAVGDRPGRDSSPEPANPTRTSDVSDRIDPDLPEGVRHFLARGEVDAWTVSAADSAVAAFWQVCGKPFDPCQQAWTIRGGGEVIGDLIDAERPFITPVPGGWLVDDQHGPTLLLTPDGDLEEVTTADIDGAPLLAGDTAVLTYDGSRLLRDGALIAMPEPADRPVVGVAYVTPSGRLVAATADLDGWRVQATDDGRTWERPVVGPSGAMNTRVVGSGDHVAVMFTGADSDGSLPVAEVLVSADAGRTWTTVRGLDTQGADRSRNPHSLAVTPSGTTYLTTETEGLVRIDSDGNALATPLSATDTSVFTRGDEVCVLAEAGIVDELQCSTDDGASWAPQPLPGFD